MRGENRRDANYAAHAPGDPRITILSDAFARDAAIHKDWGFAALVEIGGKRILFDTGNDGDHLVASTADPATRGLT